MRPNTQARETSKFSQKRYLLFRDVAAMSLALLVAYLLVMPFSWLQVGCAALFFALQTTLFAVTSQNTGIRFVANALVLLVK